MSVLAAVSVAASKCIFHVLFKAMRKPKQKKSWQRQSESDKVVEDESVNESLSISQTKAQHLERNPPLAGKYSTGSDKLPFSAVSSTWFTSILHSL